MVAFSLRSPLGLPLSEEDAFDAYAELARTGRLINLTQQDTHRAIQTLARDHALLLAGRRWVAGRPDPAQFVPGDVAAIRYLAAQTIPLTAAALEAVGKSLPDPDLRDAALLSAYGLTQKMVELTSAAPYFLPVNAALAVLRSRPPPPDLADELRLPYPQVLVAFGTDLQLDPELYPWPEPTAEEVADAIAEPYEMVGGMRTRGGYVTGMVLLADGDGRLREDLLWVVAANPASTVPFPHSEDRIRGVLRGWRSQATLRPLVDAVAAAVCWGDWQEPRGRLDLPSDDTSRQWRKAVRRGVFRRREPHGAALGVRVIDLQRSAARAATEQARERHPHASPRPHARIGHYRRVRIGPRADWHYEIRWIPPVGVLGYDLNSVDPQQMVVHRLPPPAEETPAPATLDVPAATPPGEPQPPGGPRPPGGVVPPSTHHPLAREPTGLDPPGIELG